MSNLESFAKYGRPPLVFKLRKQYVRDNLRKNIAVQDSLTLLKTCMFIKHTNISFKDLNKLRHIYVSVCIYLILWNRCRYFFSISDLASVAQWSCTGPNYGTRPMMISFILINDRLKSYLDKYREFKEWELGVFVSPAALPFWKLLGSRWCNRTDECFTLEFRIEISLSLPKSLSNSPNSKIGMIIIPMFMTKSTICKKVLVTGFKLDLINLYMYQCSIEIGQATRSTLCTRGSQFCS